jgi:hypothetical protein
VWCAFIHLWHRDWYNWRHTFPLYARDMLIETATESDREWFADAETL